MKRILLASVALLFSFTCVAQSLRYAQPVFVQSFSMLSGLGMATGTGDYAFASDVNQFFHRANGAWVPGTAFGTGAGITPTVVAGSGAGAGATITIEGNNSNCLITLTQGTGGIAGGEIMVLTLAGGVNYPNRLIPLFSPANENFRTVQPGLRTVVTGNTVRLIYTGVALTAGVPFAGNLHIVGY